MVTIIGSVNTSDSRIFYWASHTLSMTSSVICATYLLIAFFRYCCSQRISGLTHTSLLVFSLALIRKRKETQFSICQIYLCKSLTMEHFAKSLIVCSVKQNRKNAIIPKQTRMRYFYFTYCRLVMTVWYSKNQSYPGLRYCYRYSHSSKILCAYIMCHSWLHH